MLPDILYRPVFGARRASPEEVRAARGHWGGSVETLARLFDTSTLTVAAWESGAAPVPWEHSSRIRAMATDAELDAAVAQMTLPTCSWSASWAETHDSDAWERAFEETQQHERACEACKARERAIDAQLPRRLRRHRHRFDFGVLFQMLDRVDGHPLTLATFGGGAIGVVLLLLGLVISLGFERSDVFQLFAYAPLAFAALGGLGGATFVTLRRRTNGWGNASRYVSSIAAMYLMIGVSYAAVYFVAGEPPSASAWDVLKVLIPFTVLGVWIGKDSEWEPEKP